MRQAVRHGGQWHERLVGLDPEDETRFAFVLGPSLASEVPHEERVRSGDSAAFLLYWMFDRDRTSTVDWLKTKFAKKPEIMEANLRALRAGYNFGFSTESFTFTARSARASIAASSNSSVTLSASIRA